MANANKKIYFVKDFSPVVRNIKGEIIALTPSVCYQLDKEKISYKTYEDFYGLVKLNDNAEEHFSKLCLWIDSLDEYLKGKLYSPLDKKINFVRLYGYYMKNMLDPIIICSRSVSSIFEELKPLNVYLIASRPSLQYSLNSELFYEGADVSPVILPIICQQKGIPYSIISDDTYLSSASNHFLELRLFSSRIFRALGRVIDGLCIHAIYLALILKRKKLIRENKFKIFLIFTEDWLGDFYKDSIKAGHRVLYHTISGPKRPPLFRRQKRKDEVKVFLIDRETRHLWEKIGEDCIQELNPAKWPSEEAGIDLRPILNERFLYFFKKICPIISITAKQYEAVFKKKKINYVVCSYKQFPSDFGVIASATLSPGVFSVLVEHGSTETEYKIQFLSELPTDIYVTSSKEEAVFYSKYFNDRSKNSIKVTAGRVWIDRYRHDAKKITDRFSKSNDKWRLNRYQRVYYLPSTQGIQRFDPLYPLCWYFRLQQDLCRYFKERPQYHFIVKVDRATFWLSRPMAKFLKDLRATNVFYKEGDLIANLRQADRVITDFPSTPTYEARLMGLPLLSLYHESVNIRPIAKQVYGNTLVPFKTTQEAINLIDKFLSSDPQDYIVSMEDNFLSPALVEILEKYHEQDSCKK